MDVVSTATATATAPSFVRPTASTTCGATALIAGTDSTHWTPLASCDGVVGRAPLPKVTIAVGQIAFVSAPGFPGLTLTTPAADVLDIHGLQVSGLRPGTGTVLSREPACAERDANPSALCPLMTVVVE
jgi:hypothetical protein